MREQRPNMSRHLLFCAVLLLLFLLMCCGSTRATAHAADTGIASGTGAKAAPAVYPPAVSPTPSVTKISVPSVVEVNGAVVAIAQASHADNSSSVLATLIEPSEPRAVWTLPVPGGDSQRASLAGAGKSTEQLPSFINPAAVAKGNKIHVLLYGINQPQPSGGTTAAADDSCPWIVTGEVGEVEAGEGNKTKAIAWGTPTLLCSGLGTQLRERSFEFFSVSGGAGILMKNGTVVVPVGASKDGETVSLIIYSNDPENGAWELSKELSAGECFGHAVAEWKGKLLMMTECEDGYRKVYESSNMGESWTEALGTLSRVWGNSHGRAESGVQSGFITATIDGEKVMLVTAPVYSEAQDDGREDGRLHLWLTDNTHIANIGPISAAGHDAASSSLLYTDEKLISVYENSAATPPNVFSVRLTAQLTRVKEVLKTWKEVDKRVFELCRSALAKKNALASTACSSSILTNGLVGYLHGTFAGSQWKDEYLGVDATVNGAAEKSADGLTLKGRGSWAEWPVGKQGQNQLYHFANSVFTLVAVVTVHEAPAGSRSSMPLVGASVKSGSTVTTLLGLACKGKSWEVTLNGVTKTVPGKTLQLNRAYTVALMLQDNKGFVYVDGEVLESAATLPTDNSKPREVSHFYVGSNGEDREGADNNRRLTVSGVLLYNRPLSVTERNVMNSIGAKLRKGSKGDGSMRESAFRMLLLLLLLLGLCGFAAPF